MDQIDCGQYTSLNKNNNFSNGDFDTATFDQWLGNYSLGIDYGKLDECSEATVHYEISIRKNKCIFSGMGYKTYFTDQCKYEIENDQLIIKYVAQTDGNGMSDHSHLETLATIKKENNKYYIQSPIIANKNWDYNAVIEITKKK